VAFSKDFLELFTTRPCIMPTTSQNSAPNSNYSVINLILKGTIKYQQSNFQAQSVSK